MTVEELKKYRLMINQTSLAKATGITRQYIGVVASGACEPGKGFVAIIEKYDIKDFVKRGFEEYVK